MGKRIFVGNLAYSTTDDSLRAHFEAKGHEVRKATVVLDRETGRSRGFAFVQMGSDGDAAAAVQAVHGSLVDGNAVKVTVANPPKSRYGGYRRQA